MCLASTPRHIQRYVGVTVSTSSQPSCGYNSTNVFALRGCEILSFWEWEDVAHLVVVLHCTILQIWVPCMQTFCCHYHGFVAVTIEMKLQSLVPQVVPFIGTGSDRGALLC